MKTAILRYAFSIGAGACTIAALATVGAGCDNRHVLGGLGGAAGSGESIDGQRPVIDAGPDGTTDGAVGLRDGAIVTPVESWTGYIESYQFPSGSDAVKIAFASDAAGNLIGTVTLGRGTPPPPPTNPNVGYPADLLGSPQDLTSARSYIAEGFSYSMRAGTIAGARLRFAVGTWELWTDWCTLQTPAPPSGPCQDPVCKTACIPNTGYMSGPNGCGLFNPATNQYEPIDCGKLALCGLAAACLCVPSGCAVNDDGNQISFDLTITNGVASGTVIGLERQNNVHLTKDP
jgi:hypothetical protein